MTDRLPMVASTFTSPNTESKITRIYALTSEDIDEIAHAQQIYTRLVIEAMSASTNARHGTSWETSWPIELPLQVQQHLSRISLDSAETFRKQQEKAFAERYAKTDEE